jgi:cytochrome c biogenesis protein CcdA
MKKRVKIFFLVFVFIFLSNIFIYADETINIDYFTTQACLSCAKSNKYIESLVENLKEKNIDVNLRIYEIMEEENEELLVKYNNYFEVKDDKYKLIPAVFIADAKIIGKEDIEERLEEVILYYHDNPKEYFDIDIDETSLSSTVTLTGIGIFLAGLLDGINPCSIAMMLFFISFVFMSEYKEKKVLLLGTSFALGTFLAYLGIGIGLFNFMNLFKNINIIMKGFYGLLAIMGAYLAYLNISDYINIRKGKEEKIKNQLSKKNKKKIHHIIKNSKNSKTLYITAFIVAFIISFLEFFCTGQIYLPVITYMIKSTQGLAYVPLLILYNLAFIIPLLIITALIHLGKEVIDISTILVTKLHLVKLVGAVFFIGVVFYSAYQISLI